MPSSSLTATVRRPWWSGALCSTLLSASAYSIGSFGGRQTPMVHLKLSLEAQLCFHRLRAFEHVLKGRSGLQMMLRVAALAAAKSGTPPCYGLHLLRQTCIAWQLVPSAEGQSGATTSTLHTMSSLHSDHKTAFSCLTQAGPSFGASYNNLHIVRGIGSPAAAQVCIPRMALTTGICQQNLLH